MRSELSKAVRKRFETGFKRLAPEFVPVPPSFPGDRLFERRHPSGFTEYVLLDLNPKYDTFDIELGWSTRGIYALVPDMEAVAVEADEVRFSGTFLWGGPRFGEQYWVLAPLPSLDRPESFLEDPPLAEALQKVEPAVDDALRRIEQYVLPHLARAAAAHGA